MRRLMSGGALAAAALLQAASPAVFDFEQGLGKERYDRRYAAIETENPISGARSLRVDTRLTDTQWNSVWCLPAGVLQPGRSYRISLRVKVLERGREQAYPLLLIRPLSADHELSDAGMLTLQTVGKIPCIGDKQLSE